MNKIKAYIKSKMPNWLRYMWYNKYRDAENVRVIALLYEAVQSGGGVAAVWKHVPLYMLKDIVRITEEHRIEAEKKLVILTMGLTSAMDEQTEQMKIELFKNLP